MDCNSTVFRVIARNSIAAILNPNRLFSQHQPRNEASNYATATEGVVSVRTSIQQSGSTLRTCHLSNDLTLQNTHPIAVHRQSPCESLPGPSPFFPPVLSRQQVITFSKRKGIQPDVDSTRCESSAS